jgi:hypothetical protein
MYSVYLNMRSMLIVFLLALMMMLLLTACGGPITGPTGPGSTPVSTQSPGYGTANGCPDDTVFAKAPTKANVVITHADTNSTIVAHQGDTIEVDLPFGHRWGTPNLAGGLEMQQPAGYAWKPTSVCVWRFVAKTQGTAQLTFPARALCQPGELCPLYVLEYPFTITIR